MENSCIDFHTDIYGNNRRKEGGKQTYKSHHIDECLQKYIDIECGAKHLEQK